MVRGDIPDVTLASGRARFVPAAASTPPRVLPRTSICASACWLEEHARQMLRGRWRIIGSLDRITEIQAEIQRTQERVSRRFAKAHPEIVRRPGSGRRLARDYVERDRQPQRSAVRLGDSARLVEARAPLGELSAQGLYRCPTAAGWMGKLAEPSSAADYLKDLILRGEPAPADPKVTVVIPRHNKGAFSPRLWKGPPSDQYQSRKHHCERRLHGQYC